MNMGVKNVAMNLKNWSLRMLPPIALNVVPMMSKNLCRNVVTVARGAMIILHLSRQAAVAAQGVLAAIVQVVAINT